MDGEKCVSEIVDPFLGSDLLFDSFSFARESRTAPPRPPTSQSCQCGKRESCFDEHTLSQTSSRCDFEASKCMCGNKEECTGAVPWCIEKICKCSSQPNHYVKGDGTLKGTCTGENEKCMDDGACKGNNTYLWCW